MNVLASELKKIAGEANEATKERPSFILWIKEEALDWAKNGSVKFTKDVSEFPWDIVDMRNSLPSLSKDGFRCSLEDNFLKVSWE